MTSEQIVKCPYCGYVADRASEVHDDGSKPKNGDISMCIGCGGFSIFEAASHDGLREPTDSELGDMLLDLRELIKLRLGWLAVNARRKAN